MLVIDGSESPIEVRELAEYPSHGGSQGFKSPHLHPTTALVTGLAGRSRRAGAVPDPAAGQQTGSNRDGNGPRCFIVATATYAKCPASFTSRFWAASRRSLTVPPKREHNGALESTG
jgi:hypothetical protein